MVTQVLRHLRVVCSPAAAARGSERDAEPDDQKPQKKQKTPSKPKPKQPPLPSADAMRGRAGEVVVHSGAEVRHDASATSCGCSSPFLCCQGARGIIARTARGWREVCAQTVCSSLPSPDKNKRTAWLLLPVARRDTGRGAARALDDERRWRRF